MGVTGTRFTLLSDQCVYASLRFGIDLNRLGIDSLRLAPNADENERANEEKQKRAKPKQ